MRPRRRLALKLSAGDSNAADALLRETEASARALVKQYAATIRRFALRLAAKREFILDEAEAAIRQAHEEVTQRAVLDAEWQRKIARARAEQELRKVAPKQGRVIREFDFSKQADIRAWNQQMGHENVDAEPINFGVGHIVPGSYR